MQHSNLLAQWLVRMPLTSIDQRQDHHVNSLLSTFYKLKSSQQLDLEHTLVLCVHQQTLFIIIVTYVGLLQVQFLADSLRITIQQHVEKGFTECGYDTAIPPLLTRPDVKAPVMHLMWVKSSTKSRVPKHIIPLIPPVGEC